jgi:hypothetical protein
MIESVSVKKWLKLRWWASHLLEMRGWDSGGGLLVAATQK